jgi:hypothetical protein
MYLIYIDESGTPDLPGNTSHYVLAGLSIPIWKWKFCDNEIHQIKTRYRLENAEIHTGWLLRPYPEQMKISGFNDMNDEERRSESYKKRAKEIYRLQSSNNPKLYHRTKKFFRQTEAYTHLSFTDRRQFVMDIAIQIASWSFARLFAESIDKMHFNPAFARKSVDEQAFEQIVSRFESNLAIHSKSSGRKKYGLMIHDHNDTVSRKHTELMKQFHKNGTLWTSVKQIIETPLYVDSQLTSMIQLADVCSYAIRRYNENKENYLFDPIFRLADRKDGKNVGVRHFSDRNCTCDICLSH